MDNLSKRVSILTTFFLLSLTFASFGQNSELGEGWDVTEPLGEARDIEFTTDEGTWMSVDVSPNGEWIVFDLIGHIYRMPIDGGEAACITQESGLSINLQPKISPNGEYIAFISDRKGQRNLWIMNSDGSEPKPVFTDLNIETSLPTWTPDSEYIIVKKERTDEWGSGYIAMYHREGGKGIDLVSEDVSGETWPSVSQDGKYMYFQASPGGGEALNGDFQLRRYNFETGNIIDITSGNAYGPASGRLSSGGAFAPEISPNGKWLAFGRQIPDGTITFKDHEFGPRTALWVLNLETGAEKKVMDPISVALEGGGGWSIIPRYDWLPNGQSILVAQGGKIRKVDISSGEVTTIPFKANVKRRISEQAYNSFRINDQPFQPKFIRWHTRSPDNSKLAFQAVGQIWVMNYPDGEPRRLTPESFDYAEFSPVWSPDSRSIAFTTLSESNSGHVWRVSVDDGSPKRLTQKPSFYTHLVWNPNGRNIVAIEGGGATSRGRTVTHNAFFKLIQIPADGGDSQQLTIISKPTGTSPGEHARRAIPQPSYGPDGRIYFPQPTEDTEDYIDDDIVTSLVSIKPDGTDRKVHMIFPYADEVVPSPDGKNVAFQEGDNIYLTKYPKIGTGDKPVFIDKRDGALPVKQLSHTGGLFPKWWNNSILEFGSANQYYAYDTGHEQKDTLDIEFKVARDNSKGTIAIEGARILTMNDREIIENGRIIIKDSRIECVGDVNECDKIEVDRSLDASGKTIIPGLIDMHSHHYRENRGHRPPNDYEVAMYLAYGVTTNLDNSMWSQNIFPAAERIEAGRLIGPRTFSTGDPLYQGDGARHNKITSYKVAHDNVKRLKSWGAVGIKQYSHPRRDQRQWIIDASRMEDLMVTGHWKLSVIMDGHTGWEHALDFNPMYGDFAEFYGKANAVYSPTWVVGGNGMGNIEKFFSDTNVWQKEKQQIWMPWRMLTFLRRRTLAPETDYNYPLIAQAAVDIVDKGGHAVIGSHGEHHGLAPHWEIWMAAEAFGPMGALEVATKEGAYFLGATEDIGTLEEGKLADLLILNSNPLENIKNTEDIEYVMKGGKLYDSNSLDQLWPTEKVFGEKYWIDEATLIDDTRAIDR